MCWYKMKMSSIKRASFSRQSHLTPLCAMSDVRWYQPGLLTPLNLSKSGLGQHACSPLLVRVAAEFRRNAPLKAAFPYHKESGF